MPFANENDVRQTGFLDRFDAVTSEQIRICLEKAHQQILSGTSLTEESEAVPTVIQAEAKVALSHLFQAMAIASAVTAKNIRVSGMQMNGQSRVENMMALSQELWEEGWGMLHPYMNCSVPKLLIANRT